MQPVPRRTPILIATILACACLPAGAAGAPPKAQPLSSGLGDPRPGEHAAGPHPAAAVGVRRGRDRLDRERPGAGRAVQPELEVRPGAGRVRGRRQPVAVRRHGQAVPPPLHRAPQGRGLHLGLPLRGLAPAHHRLPERPQARRQHRPLHAVRAAGQGPARRAAQRPGGHRGQPQGPAAARGLVELRRHRAPGLADPQGPDRRQGPGLPERRDLQGPGHPVQGRGEAGRDPVQAAQGAPALQDHGPRGGQGQEAPPRGHPHEDPPDPAQAGGQAALAPGPADAQELQAQRPAQRPPPAQGPGGAGAGARSCGRRTTRSCTRPRRAWSTRAAPSRSTARRSACARSRSCAASCG